ncbi:MAG TPA: PepSY domain-containing protein [Novosphingobium sp.]|nr:PepSY domain-containing protein [Novosphingobium sp.]
MAKRTLMQRFARWHIWLGWAVGVPLLLWTASGLFMAARPIEQVRGEDLRAVPVPVAGSTLTFPKLAGSITKVTLVGQPAQPVWIVTGGDGQPHRYAARTGVPLGAVSEAEARAIAAATFTGKAQLTRMQRLSAAQAPLDLRRPRPSWQASFADGTHLYIDASTGEVLALRTRWWRIYDFMWGLHIMDLQTREDTSHPILILFAALAVVGSIFGTTLLFRRRKARR